MDLADTTMGKPSRRLLRKLKQLDRIKDLKEVNDYRDRIVDALTLAHALREGSQGKREYIPGEDIRGAELFAFAEEPRLSAPIRCSLCGAGFLLDRDFLHHVEDAHGPYAEYRKRVLFKMEEKGPCRLTGEEKRLIIQNVAYFQQYSEPGSGGNWFSPKQPVPRSEAACAICARWDWKEHRYELNLFGKPPVYRTRQRNSLFQAVADTSSSSEDSECQRSPSTNALSKALHT